MGFSNGITAPADYQDDFGPEIGSLDDVRRAAIARDIKTLRGYLNMAENRLNRGDLDGAEVLLKGMA
jgi:hypothetical protein